MGTVAGLRTRRYHGLLVVAVDGPGAADARARRARSGARRRRRALSGSRPTNGERRRRPARARAARVFDLDDGVPRWRWQVGGIVLERELAMAHGTPTVGVVHRLLARRPAGAARADAALHLARASTASGFADGAPESSRTTDGFVFEGAYRVDGAG